MRSSISTGRTADSDEIIITTLAPQPIIILDDSSEEEPKTQSSNINRLIPDPELKGYGNKSLFSPPKPKTTPPIEIQNKTAEKKEEDFLFTEEDAKKNEDPPKQEQEISKVEKEYVARKEFNKETFDGRQAKTKGKSFCPKGLGIYQILENQKPKQSSPKPPPITKPNVITFFNLHVEVPLVKPPEINQDTGLDLNIPPPSPPASQQYSPNVEKSKLEKLQTLNI